ncbi:lytic transglycosylase domain-containing protein [Burkholderia stabilis]|uniref:Lytic transglycosylase domain-containing protein n=2 Tax=Burkholderia stabilis TaxID=95485 RepID=A0A4Q2AAR1_9BURK|nr:lytic transglycosylase domain-containing protein [Burkholderia stabilis]
MRPAHPDPARSGRHLRCAVWLLLTAIARPGAAQDLPAPLVWTQVEPTQADGRPVDTPAALPEPVDHAPRHAMRATRYDKLIDAVASQFDLDTALLHAMIEVESRYDANARSPKGAVGLMQVMPATGRRFGFVDLDDPDTNLRAGATYLKWLLRTFDNDLELAVAGYNAGEGAVMKSGWKIPPYRETQLYVSTVLKRYRSTGAASAPDANADSTGRHRHRIVARPRPPSIAVLGKLASLLLSSPHASAPANR